MFLSETSESRTGTTKTGIANSVACNRAEIKNAHKRGGSIGTI